MALLHVENMTHWFGGLRAVHGYNLEVEPGQIRGLIGPNGAGKTTVFNLITGRYKPTEGKILLEPVTPVSITALYGKYPDADFLADLEAEHRREVAGEEAFRA